jgi:TonB family protein
MKQSYLAIISGTILFVILAISWCGRKPKPEYAGVPVAPQTASPAGPALPSAAPSSAQTSSASQAPGPDFRKVRERVSPAVIQISVFDEPGNLVRTGTGFFISEDGRFVTNWHVVKDGAHGVAKMSDGGIYNVTGTLTGDDTLDLAVLQAEVKKQVPFLTPGKAAGAQPGTWVAAIASPLARGAAPLFEATIATRKTDENGERLELAAPPPNDMTGAPVVNQNGELLGVVTPQGGQANAANIVRSFGAIDLLVTKIESNAKPRWDGARARPSPSPSSEEEEAEATPQPSPKIVTATTTTLRTGKPKIIYNPKPPYPGYSYFHEKGSGRFRITFSTTGEAKNVEVIESTRSQALDNVTLEALRRWKATPGQEWNVTVPVTFEKR